MDTPKGERMTAPVAFPQILVAPWAMCLTAGYEKDTDDGDEKSTNVRTLTALAAAAPPRRRSRHPRHPHRTRTRI